MKIKFIRDQEYQLDAISSIVDIFQGQAIKAANFTVSLDDQVKMHETDLGIGNLLELTDEELLSSVNDIQMRNGLPKSIDINNRNFTIEMETGERVIIVTGCINALVSRVSGTLIKNNSCIA